MPVYTTLLVERREPGIAIVTLNRPEAMNCLVREMYLELGAAFAELAGDDAVRVVLLTGAGERAFCAGADIGMMADTTPSESRAMCKRFHEAFLAVERIEKPVIGVINGYALGGGCEVALLCDVRIAADTARFGLPEARHGILPGSGGTQRLTRLIGPSRAKHIMFSAQHIDAQTALAYGLCEQVVPQTELMEAALKMARQFLKQSSLSLGLIKTAVNLAVETDLQTGLAYEAEAFAVAFSSEEKERRMAEFLKR